MKSSEIRKKYLEFFKERGHKIVSSASLLPENDPTTLFTGSGMQPMVPYLLGEKYPGGEKRIANSQKCFRSGDIEEVGDNRHTTFFEMLGNWSLGDYFKKEQIPWMFEFLTKELKLDPERIYVSVYRGNEKLELPREEEAVKLWQEQFTVLQSRTDADIRQGESQINADLTRNDADGTRTNAENIGTVDLIELRKEGVGLQGIDMSTKARIFYYPDSENWWSRAGGPDKMPEDEPGGPDSEMFWDFGPELKLHENSEWKNQPCHPACDCGRFVEIGNNVFMQYKKTKDGFEELENKNIDFGGGLERLAMAVNDTPDVFLIDLFKLSREKIEEISGKKYNREKQQRGRTSSVATLRSASLQEITSQEEDKARERFGFEEESSDKRGDGKGRTLRSADGINKQNETTRSMRVILDHLRAATFLINDGANPSNKDQGYFTRRLIRRAVRFGHQLGIEKNFTKEIAKTFIETYGDYYTDLRKNEGRICQVIEEEEKKFRKTLIKGLKMLEKLKDKNEDKRGKGFASKRTEAIAEGRERQNLEERGVQQGMILGKDIFDLYQTYGFPVEMSFEELEKAGIKFNKEQLQKEFDKELQKHKDLSRTASAGKFKGGLAGDDEVTTQLHTVTHLMLAGLRKVLGDSVSQKGSNITPERIRFDFSFDRAMTEEEKIEVEKFVNKALKSGAKVTLTEMPKQQAIDEGVTGAFWEKYPEQVKVYTITAPDGTVYSRELCGGPHVKNLEEIKGTFKITKEKSSGAGVRRVKAVVL